MCISSATHENILAAASNSGSGGGGPASNVAATPREVLPANVKPTNYAVHIYPDLKTFRFRGCVDVSLDVLEPTSSITCNALQLEFPNGAKDASVSFTDANGKQCTILAKDLILDPTLERVEFILTEQIPIGARNVVLRVSYFGIHNDEMAGFYRSGFTRADGSKEYMVVTQFEATDCRRALPCWDEPNLKSTFNVKLTIPKGLTALSNMNSISETDNGDDTMTVAFATTPKMSTYLLAFAVGDFEFIETESRPTAPANAKPIKCRVYTRKGQIEQGRFALEVCARTLEFFSKYFEIAYPLPKMDMIAVPDFSAGAMENWGLVTYRDATLLFDEKNSSATAKQHVAYVVGHELAHQWFGNLVTMDWWNELWLNEGFATFVGTLVVDHLYPEWKIWTQFITNDLSLAMSLDSLRSSHPIDVDVPRAADIKSIFDHVSYYKGASVIRMLNSFLGSETFRKGVVRYLQASKFSNATTKDLWDALSAESGQDVNSFMKTWIKEVGFPVVKVVDESYNASKEEMTLTLTQERYLTTNDLSAKEREEGSVWWIPIGILTHGNSSAPITKILSKRKDTITFPYKKADKQWWKLNYNTTGLYRVDLNDTQIKHLGKSILDSPSTFAVEDRVGIVNDSFELAKAGYAPLSNYLDLLQNFANEEEYIVLSGIASGLSSIKMCWYREPKEVTEGIKKLQLKIFAPKAHSLGLDYDEKDDHLTNLKRALVLGVAAAAGDEKTVSEFTSRFAKFIAAKTPEEQGKILNPNVRGIAYRTVLKNSKNDEECQKLFDSILEIFKTASTPDGKLTALGSLGAANSVKVIEAMLKDVVLNTEIVRPQDAMYIPRSIATENPNAEFARRRIFQFIRENIGLLYDRYASSFSLLGHMVVGGMQSQVGADVIKEIEAFTTSPAGKYAGETEEQGKKRVASMELITRPVAQALERMRANTAWVERERDSVANWVKTNTK